MGDFGGYANTRTGIDDKALTYLFGPRFNWRHSRFNPYVQFLFGGAYAWSGPNEPDPELLRHCGRRGLGLEMD